MSQSDDYKEIQTIEAARVQLREKDLALDQLKGELAECHGRISVLAKNSVDSFVQVIASTRKDSTCIPLRRLGRVITDRVFHEMYLEAELDILLRHPLVDRLRSVKQLSFTYQEQPTALHTRLSHSLGVARNVEFALQRIFERNKLYVIESKENRRGKIVNFAVSSDDRRKLIQLGKTAALLHDSGHSPFGHTLDRFITAQLYKNQVYLSEKPDKYYSSRYVKSFLSEALKSCDLSPQAVAKIISPAETESEKKSWSQYLPLLTAIIDSDLDADRIDYLMRDSDSTGLPYGSINGAALLSSMLPTVEESTHVYGVAFDEHAVGFIGHAVNGRIRMYEECYETQVKVASETMLTNALRHFLNRYNSLNVDDLLVLTDDELLAVMIANSPPGTPEHSLVDLLIKQRYFAPIILPIRLDESQRGYPSTECDRYLEAAAADEFVLEQDEIPLDWQKRITLKLPKNHQWMVCVYATPYDRFEVKEQQIRIVQESGSSTFTYVTLAEKEKAVVQMLADRVRSNPRIEVFAHSDLPNHEVEEVRKASDLLFGKKKE